MSLAFPSPEFIPPGYPPAPEWERPWNPLHRQTLVFLFAMILIAGILEFFPIFDRSDPNRFVDADPTYLGFPLSYVIIGIQSTKVDFIAFLADILAVGALIVALTCWMERWMRRPTVMPPWFRLHNRTWVLLAGLILAGVIVEVYPFIYEYGDEIRNFPDDMGGNHWMGRGIPFAYHRVDPAEKYSGNFGVIRPFRITFDLTVLVFDFILIAAAIAEATYWFEKWQRGPRVLIIEED